MISGNIFEAFFKGERYGKLLREKSWKKVQQPPVSTPLLTLKIRYRSNQSYQHHVSRGYLVGGKVISQQLVEITDRTSSRQQ